MADVTFGMGEKATGQPGVGAIEKGQLRKLGRDAFVVFGGAAVVFAAENAGSLGGVLDVDPETIVKLAGLVAALFGWRVARPTSPDP